MASDPFSSFQLKEYIDDTEDFINIQLVHQHISYPPYPGIAHQIYAFLTIGFELTDLL